MTVVLHPVVLRTPGQERTRASVERVRSQRTAARAAVHASAERSGARLAHLPQDEDGAPLPAGEWRWSASHDSGLVAGVVARIGVGIDVERARMRREELVRRVLDPDERALLGPLDGVGLGALSRCRLVAVPGPGRLLLELDGEPQRVEQRRLGERVVSVHAAGELWCVDWSGAEVPR